MAYLGTPIDTQNQFQSLQGKRFSGDGSTTAFTLDIAPSSVFDIEVFVENVRQDPNSAYGISGTTLTFTGAPPSGTNNIYVVHQAKAVGTIDVPASGVVPASLASNIISGQTELAVPPATTDEFLISDGGTIKRIDYSLVGSTPAFSARMSGAQTVSTNTYTKIDFDTEIFDTNSAYDHSTNQRFTVPANMAGKYVFYAAAICDAAGAAQLENARIAIYKNGSIVKMNAWNFNSNDIYYAHLQITHFIDLAASDYIEAYVRISDASGSPVVDGSAVDLSEFSGYRLAGA